MGARLCTVEGCGRKHHARGMCIRHYDRWRYRWPELVDNPHPRLCDVEGCHGRHYGWGCCRFHYLFFRRSLQPPGTLGRPRLREPVPRAVSMAPERRARVEFFGSLGAEKLLVYCNAVLAEAMAGRRPLARSVPWLTQMVGEPLAACSRLPHPAHDQPDDDGPEDEADDHGTEDVEASTAQRVALGVLVDVSVLGHAPALPVS